MWRELFDGAVRVDGVCVRGGDMGGIGTDSSSSMGAGSMMGQTDMGTMTWQLTQNGSTVTGP
jgi:hypothetical protein